MGPFASIDKDHKKTHLFYIRMITNWIKIDTIYLLFIKYKKILINLKYTPDISNNQIFLTDMWILFFLYAVLEILLIKTIIFAGYAG